MTALVLSDPPTRHLLDKFVHARDAWHRQRVESAAASGGGVSLPLTPHIMSNMANYLLRQHCVTGLQATRARQKQARSQITVMVVEGQTQTRPTIRVSTHR